MELLCITAKSRDRGPTWVTSAILCTGRGPVSFRYTTLATAVVARCNMLRKATFELMHRNKGALSSALVDAAPTHDRPLICLSCGGLLQNHQTQFHPTGGVRHGPTGNVPNRPN